MPPLTTSFSLPRVVQVHRALRLQCLLLHGHSLSPCLYPLILHTCTPHRVPARKSSQGEARSEEGLSGEVATTTSTTAIATFRAVPPIESAPAAFATVAANTAAAAPFPTYSAIYSEPRVMSRKSPAGLVGDTPPSFSALPQENPSNPSSIDSSFSSSSSAFALGIGQPRIFYLLSPTARATLPPFPPAEVLVVVRLVARSGANIVPMGKGRRVGMERQAGSASASVVLVVSAPLVVLTMTSVVVGQVPVSSDRTGQVAMVADTIVIFMIDVAVMGTSPAAAWVRGGNVGVNLLPTASRGMLAPQ